MQKQAVILKETTTTGKMASWTFFAPDGERCAFAHDGSCAFAKRCNKEKKPLVYTRLNRKVPSRYSDPTYRGKWCCGKCYVKIAKILQLQKQTNGVEDTTPEEGELLEKIRALAIASAVETTKTWKVNKKLNSQMCLLSIGTTTTVKPCRPNVRHDTLQTPSAQRERSERNSTHFEREVGRREVEGVTLRWYRREEEDKISREDKAKRLKM